MKDNVKAALVQFSPKPMQHMEQNVEFITNKIVELSNKGNELIVFPEMSITNFFEHGPEGKIQYWNNGSLSVDDNVVQKIVEVTKKQNCYAIVGFAERSRMIGKIYNSAACIGPKGIIGITRKVHFPGLEKLYYSKGTEIPVFDTPLGKIGISICYDSMFVEYLRALAVKGAEIIVMTSSIWKGGGKGGIGLETSKSQFWDLLPMVASVEHQSFVIACNGGGSHMIGEKVGTWERLGLSKIVDPTGDVLTKTDGNDEVVLNATLEEKKLKESRMAYSFLNDREPELYQELTELFN
ncbi:carbon-nitrogen hydrolase family protein [Alteribacillus sp. JSM 102045]|uniref:carbon-nitrogen hydrolase family protein n=1 Tax=Alteribacillus sp. JSM 102045 TaxID=1562101 RepID=UPI0035BECBB8